MRSLLVSIIGANRPNFPAVELMSVFTPLNLMAVMASPHHELAVPDISWVVIQGGVTIHLGLIVDSLTAVMLIVVTLLA